MLSSLSPITVVHRSFEALGSPPSPMVLEVSVPRGVRTVELSWLANRVLALEQDLVVSYRLQLRPVRRSAATAMNEILHNVG